MENLLLLEKQTTIDGIGVVTIRFVPIEYSDTTTMLQRSAGEQLHLLYVAPLRAADITTVSYISRRLQLLSFTGVPEYVEEGIAVGIGSKGGKPLLWINISGVKAEGFHFSARLLSLSKIIE